MAINASLNKSISDIVVSGFANVVGSADTLFLDTFTDNADVALQDHPPDIGDSWTRVWGSNATVDIVISADNTATPEADQDDGVVYTADTTYPSADYQIEVMRNGVPQVLTRPSYFFLRFQDIDNFYALEFLSQGNGRARLYRKVSGTFTQIGDPFHAPIAFSNVKFRVVGNLLVVLYDNVVFASETDSNITAAGKAGFGAGGGSELPTSSLDSHHNNVYDDFIVSGIEPIAGVLSKTLDNITVTAAGQVKIAGVVSQTLDNITLSAAGMLPLQGALLQTLADITLAGTGALSIQGTASQTLDNITLTATASLQNRGIVAATLADVTLSASGHINLNAFSNGGKVYGLPVEIENKALQEMRL